MIKLSLLCFLVSLAILSQLTACTTSKTFSSPAVGAAEYRQQASLAIHENRFADGTKLLIKAIKLEPRGSDYLLLGNLQETLEKYRQALKYYQKGLEYAVDAELKLSLSFLLATLEALEFDQFEKAATQAKQLPDKSAHYLNLQALLAIQQNHYDAAIRLTEQIVSSNQEQEMTGWAHYHAARAWAAVGNDPKAFQALFFAINNARGHGLVARITRLWEELKQLPLAE